MVDVQENKPFRINFKKKQRPNHFYGSRPNFEDIL